MKKKKIFRNKIIFCTSYMNIPLTISMIEEYGDAYIVITESKQIYEFLIKFYSKSRIILIKLPLSILNVNPIKVALNLYKNFLIKLEVKKLLNQYKNYDVYFFFKAFGPQMSYSLRILSFNNKIYFKQEMKDKFLYIKKRPPLKIFLWNIYLKIMYGVYCDPVIGIDKRFVLMLSDKFYRSINAKKINIKENINILKKFQRKYFKINENKILLLSSNEALKFKIIDKNLYNLWIQKWIKQSNSKKILFKRKDQNEKKYFKENILLEIPCEWPANILLYGFKTVVGYHSATLFEASNAGCKVISLLDLLKSNETKNQFKHHKKYLIKNLSKNKKINFPKTFKTFDKIMNNVKT